MCGNKRWLWDALASHKVMMVVSYNGGKGGSMLRGWKSPEESIFNFFGMYVDDFPLFNPLEFTLKREFPV